MLWGIRLVCWYTLYFKHLYYGNAPDVMTDVTKSSKMIFMINSFNWWQTFMVTCLWIKSLPPCSLGMHFPKRICQVCKYYYWWLSDSWRHLWCGHFSMDMWRTVWCCSAALSTPPQIIAQEQKSHSSQVSRPPLSFSFSPSPPPTHGGMFVCLWESASYIELNQDREF